jgi:SNF2 family DNA or RNA helicase
MPFSSLLSAKYFKNGGYWTFDFRELEKLSDNLEMLGIKKCIDEDGIEKFLSYKRVQKRLDDVKEGKCDIDVKMFKTMPFEEQKIGVDYLSRKWLSGLFDEMGLGKTKQVLDTLVLWREKGKVKGNGIVICPNTAKFSWCDEIELHSNFTHFEIGNGTATCRRDIQFVRDNPKDLFIVHMDALRYIQNDLLKMNPAFVFVDEFHFFKSVGTSRKDGSLRSQALFHMIDIWKKRNPSLKVIVMTGTPVAERPEEAYAVLEMLLPGFIASHSRFLNRYCNFEFNHYYIWKTDRVGRRKRIRQRVREVVSYKNLKELKGLIELCGIRRLKSEVKGFPEKIEITKYIILTGKHLSDYEKVKNATREEILKLKSQGRDFNVANKFVRLMQVVNNPAVLDGDDCSCKYDLLDELLDEILWNSDEKVIVWAIFRRAIELLYKRYDKRYGTDCIFGDVPIESRGDVIKRFNEEKRPRVLICHPAAGGTSLNLQRAQTAIYVDQMFALTQRLQSEDRIHRRSSKGTVRIINIVAKGTVDEPLVKLLKEKRNMKDALLTSDDLLVKNQKEHLLKYLE